jgi:ABC-type uncharacterized transport system, ATPase component
MKLEVKNLRKSFGDKEVLHGISFSVESGKALGLLGRNGAGKTTTIRILMDVFKGNSGVILLDGKPFVPNKNDIGYLPEERGLYPKKKVGEQVIYLACLRGMSPAAAKKSTLKWLKKLGVDEHFNKKLETLSKGNQQKVQLAQTLVCNPQIVILDEPFSGLDPVNSQILKDVVTELIQEKRLVIFSSHQMSYVEEFCEHIAIINHGEVVIEGHLKDIKQDYGKDRLVLSSLNYSIQELRKICESQFNNIVTVVEMKKDVLILQLKNDSTKNMLLQNILTTDINIEKFAVYEPTLTDIFVDKAGDHE